MPTTSFTPAIAPAMIASMAPECCSTSGWTVRPSVIGSPRSGSRTFDMTIAAGADRIDAEIRCPAMPSKTSFR